MREPIQADYVPDGDDWSVTVSGRGQRLTGTAPGLIAARDRADQLVEKLAPEEKHRTVVHLLNGDAVEFTTAYLTARLSRTAEPAKVPQDAQPAKPATDGKQPVKEPKATQGGQPAKATGAAAAPKLEPKPVPVPIPGPKPRPTPKPQPEKDKEPAAELNGAASPPA